MLKSFLLSVTLSLIFQFSFSQGKLPLVKLKTLEGQEISTSQLTDSAGYVVISFWATWCKPCMQELDAITEQYDSWKKSTNSTLVAVAIDDSRTLNGVKSIASGRGWPFTIYLDANQEFKRALNINAVPYTIIINKKGEIIKRHPGYTPGSENDLKKFLKKQKD